MLQFFRVFFILKYLISLSIFKSSRSARICKMFGESPTDIFAVRCYFDYHPIYLLVFMFTFWLCFFTYTLRLFERVYYINDMPATSFNRIDNSLWCIFITMMTVGYGDYYPVTDAGKCVVFIASLTGIILNCLLTVSFFKSLNFSSNEIKVYLILERLRMREEVDQINKEIIRLCCHKYLLYFRNRRTKDISEKQKNNELVEKLNLILSKLVKNGNQIKKYDNNN